jgi:hypothetical protein
MERKDSLDSLSELESLLEQQHQKLVDLGYIETTEAEASSSSSATTSASASSFSSVGVAAVATATATAATASVTAAVGSDPAVPSAGAAAPASEDASSQNDGHNHHAVHASRVQPPIQRQRAASGAMAPDTKMFTSAYYDEEGVGQGEILIQYVGSGNLVGNIGDDRQAEDDGAAVVDNMAGAGLVQVPGGYGGEVMGEGYASFDDDNGLLAEDEVAEMSSRVSFADGKSGLPPSVSAARLTTSLPVLPVLVCLYGLLLHACIACYCMVKWPAILRQF